jgi:4-amino-4-deoxy-L-arabinose transferase-like glycosyltransferase
MSISTRHQFGLAAIASAVFFTNLGGTHLWDEDEPKNAECAREMLAHGDFIVPWFNELPRFDKPVLLYWLMIGAYRVFGVTEFAARFWSAACGIGTVLCTYHLGRVLFRPEVGWWAGLVLTASLLFGVASRSATPDAALIFFTTAGLTCFAATTVCRGDVTSMPRLRWPVALAMYALLSVAVLAKGPVGIVLPGIVIATFAWCHAPARTLDAGLNSPWGRRLLHWTANRFHPRHIASVIWRLRPFTALFVLSVIALPWYVAVGIQTRGEWLEMFLGRHNLERFVSTLDGHRGPIVYYVPVLFAGFFPWSILLPQTVREAGRRLRDGEVGSRGDLYLACWAIAFVGFFSVAGTKLPNYITPCYPALAVLTARMIDDYLAQPRRLDPFGWRVSLLCLGGVGVALSIGLPIASATVFPGDAWVGAAGVVPIVAAWFAWDRWRRGELDRGLRCIATASVIFSTGLFAVVMPRVDRHHTSEMFVRTIRQFNGANEAPFQLMTYRFSQPSLIFYARQRIHNWSEAAKVEEFFRTNPERAYVVTRDEFLPELRPILPPDVVVLDRRPQFLRQDREVLLLGRSPPAPAEFRTAERTPSPSRN